VVRRRVEWVNVEPLDFGQSAMRSSRLAAAANSSTIAIRYPVLKNFLKQLDRPRSPSELLRESRMVCSSRTSGIVEAETVCHRDGGS
jgi:hypothetical protein